MRENGMQYVIAESEFEYFGKFSSDFSIGHEYKVQY